MPIMVMYSEARILPLTLHHRVLTYHFWFRTRRHHLTNLFRAVDTLALEIHMWIMFDCLLMPPNLLRGGICPTICHYSFFRLPLSTTIYHAEAYVVYKALHHVQKCNIQCVLIITDSSSVLVSLASYHWPRDPKPFPFRFTGTNEQPDTSVFTQVVTTNMVLMSHFFPVAPYFSYHSLTGRSRECEDFRAGTFSAVVGLIMGNTRAHPLKCSMTYHIWYWVVHLSPSAQVYDAIPQWDNKENYQDPSLTFKVDIGFCLPKPSRTDKLKEQLEFRQRKQDRTVEKLSRSHNWAVTITSCSQQGRTIDSSAVIVGRQAVRAYILVPLDDVKEEWLKSIAPHQIKTVAEHYGIFKHLFGDAYFYPQVMLDIYYKQDEDLYMKVHRGNVVKPSEVLRKQVYLKRRWFGRTADPGVTVVSSCCGCGRGWMFRWSDGCRSWCRFSPGWYSLTH
ncbi:hypothetical protein PR048_002197 [Dryococelus australis]|uniref:Uncharacterized protein n=1 Tax=Dryococelus australis TaxID=614101 RepID=A0ABQ9IJI2_9NEOP|nr:hypothetical protein PR048_002197 [Dryococelus australis]